MLPSPVISVLAPFVLSQNEAHKLASDMPVNILLVDDRPDKLLALEATLAGLGENLVQARSGTEALRLLLQQEFAVILLDVSMPGMDGFETASLIRQRASSERTPIIFVTGVEASRECIARGYSLGAVDYMVTPTVPEVLRAKVSVFVSLHKQAELIKRQSEQVQRLNHELERRVAALTAANRELEAFNYSIAHDLRTPLRSMSGFSQVLLEDESAHLTPMGLEYATRIASSAKYMDTLLLDLLAYSRLTQTEMHPEPIFLEDAVKEILSVMEKEIQDRAAEIEIVPPLGVVRAHLPTVKQVVSNLVSNSLKFVTPGRSPWLRIFATPLAGFKRLWVEDNGIGIPPGHHEKIFGLSQRLHDLQTYPGTGIGLALVRKGAERMGGRAGVESLPGRGSRFWVDLPAVEGVQNG